MPSTAARLLSVLHANLSGLGKPQFQEKQTVGHILGKPPAVQGRERMRNLVIECYRILRPRNELFPLDVHEQTKHTLQEVWKGEACAKETSAVAMGPCVQDPN